MSRVRIGYAEWLIWLLGFISVMLKLFRALVHIAISTFKVNDVRYRGHACKYEGWVDSKGF
ncbi:hypothetical protein B7P43_G10774 [Cryptotermes secundus]|uniref:Uncharacterized protein n=1 Tax=Cryptotermes secundus TaxID=105785 RepID=A0A2J7QKX7_9NEOP|nr:hypothetical protein B7P43_G10774 [Cryptotermes secundus]